MESGKSTVRIGTHDKFFYCSEVLACVLLKLLPQYRNASIVRSRDQSVLDTCDIVVGVGGEYDPSRHRYDHHMRGLSMSTVITKPGYDWTIKLSSAGLIYCHFGHEILRSVLSDVTEDKVIDEIFKIIYDTLIKEIDVVQNDLRMYDAERLYRANTDLSGRVSRLNPLWESPDLNFEEQFAKAMALVRSEFLETVQDAKNIWLPARDIVRGAVESRSEVDSSGEIIVLPKTVPFMEQLFYLFQLEKEMNVSPSIKYVIDEYTARPYMGNKYWIRCIPVAHGSSERRILLPEAWGGLRTDALVKACGIEGALLVTSDRSFGIHRTKEGAMTMARKALTIGKTVCSKADRTRESDNDSPPAKRRA